MSGNALQKLKLLYLMKIFCERTDEKHLLSCDDIIGALSEYGISAERKSVYNDIKRLQDFGFDINFVKGKVSGYCIYSRDFEISELKLLVDAVQSSKFITKEKSAELIKKIGTLCSLYQANDLNRQLYMLGVSKTENQGIYYVIDAIYDAISQDRQIYFKYIDYISNGVVHYHNEGRIYTVSPYALIWNNEYYYLAAYYEKYKKISNFRVDRMEKVMLGESPRLGGEEFVNFSPSHHLKTQFSMFGGKEERVTLKFKNSLARVVVDRFGDDIKMIPCDEDSFTIRITVQVSPAFLSWIFQFGERAEVLYPQSLRDQMNDSLSSVMKLYDGDGKNDTVCK